MKTGPKIVIVLIEYRKANKKGIEMKNTV